MEKKYLHSNWIAEFGPVGQREGLTDEQLWRCDNLLDVHLSFWDNKTEIINASAEDRMSFLYKHAYRNAEYLCFWNENERGVPTLPWDVKKETWEDFVKKLKKEWLLSSFVEPTYGDYLEACAYSYSEIKEDEEWDITANEMVDQIKASLRVLLQEAATKEPRGGDTCLAGQKKDLERSES